MRKTPVCKTNFTLETSNGVLPKSIDPDQMPFTVSSDPGLYYFASCSAIFQQKNLYRIISAYFKVSISKVCRF